MGPNARGAWTAASSTLGAAGLHVDASTEAGELLLQWLRRGDAVLVKGSRGMRMERVIEALEGREGRDAG